MGQVATTAAAVAAAVVAAAVVLVLEQLRGLLALSQFAHVLVAAVVAAVVR